MAVRIQRADVLGRLLLLAVFLFTSLAEPVRAHAVFTTHASSRCELPLEGETHRPPETAYPAIFVPQDQTSIGFVASANPVNNIDPSGHWSLSTTLTTAGIGASVGALSTVVANHALGRAQTTSSILMGAGLGAVLGPLAAEYAWFGVAVGGVGVASSGTMVWEVFSNPNSTYVQKVEASALLVASVWGTSVGLKYARAARTQAAEQAAAAPTTKRLFRVISENELVNVRRTGEFAVTSESSNPQPGGLPGKWFYGTRQEAEAFAAAHASENPRIVATEVTQAAIKQVFPNIDGGKTGYFVHLEDLAGAEIKWLPWP